MKFTFVNVTNMVYYLKRSSIGTVLDYVIPDIQQKLAHKKSEGEKNHNEGKK